MNLLRIGNRTLNMDRAISVNTQARAQHHNPSRGTQGGWVDDAVSIVLAGVPDKITLFDEEAQAVRDWLKANKQVIDLTPQPPTPTPAAELTPPPGPSPAPAPAAPSTPVTATK